MIAEIDSPSSVVVIGISLFIAGKTNRRMVLVKIINDLHKCIPLPDSTEIPRLGLANDNLLAVYPYSIYVLIGQKWRQLYKEEIDTAQFSKSGLHKPLSLPTPEIPPVMVDSIVYLRNSEIDHGDLRLWWLELTSQGKLPYFDEDTKLVGPNGPRWENVFGYVVKPNKELWVAADGSLVHRSVNGQYEIAIINGTLSFSGELLDNSPEYNVKGLCFEDNHTLLLVSSDGFFKLNLVDKSINKIAVFRNTSQLIPLKDHNLNFDMSFDKIFPIKKAEKYLISGEYGGVYLLEMNNVTKRHSMISLDEVLGTPIKF
jgi:hypothetical protein